ncbi:MAG: DUF4340 domain-containing protein [Chloroflexi bacterium]|nr:DUF4340 domain-containing protein [Chloroflexota bacterium]
MGSKQMLLFGVVFVGLAAFVYFYEVAGQASAVPTPTPGPSVVKLEAKDVTSIQSTHEGKTVKVVRENGRWKLVVPETADAEQERLDELAGRIAAMNSVQVVAQKADNLANFGLDPPQVRAVVTTAQGETIELLVGKESLDKNYYFVKRADRDPVFLVTAFTAGRLKGLVNEVPRAPTPTPAT